ncbi:nuclear body protein SP140-like protein [Otolemur garnettii]|uniref:nuclear body protein SP140-like protein n=1 Tax=Otolemur garnettii TaxID=30611 RepID=UPI000C7F5245|nr:nuclear body protein SP140-like protein [Otolemur garnettii]
MASGNRDLSTRISTEDQDIEDKCIDNCVFNHFKKLKVDISYAITRIFPFLERLRDHEVITNKLYEDSQESFRNLLQKVVYNVLNELEKTFNPEVLKEVFSEANMMEYPGLIPIYESFRNVVPDQSYLQESDEEARMEGPSSQLSLEQGTDESSIPSLTPSHSDSPISTGLFLLTALWTFVASSYSGMCYGSCLCVLLISQNFHSLKPGLGTIPPENGLLEQFCETQQVKRRRKGETRDKNDALGSQEANQQCAQKPEPAESCEPVVNNGDAENETPRPARCDEQRAEVPNQGIPIKPCVVSLVDIKKEKTFFNSDVEQQDQARTNHKQESDMIDISSEDTEESSDEDKHSAMESIPVTSNYDSSESNEGEDIQEATCSRSQTAPVSRFPRDENINFQLPELPVTCGDLKGTLHKKKLKQGSPQKSIQTENGRWLTPREFEIKGGYEQSKKWKHSIRCGRYRLQDLMEKGVLPNPPKPKRKVGVRSNRRRTKRKPENSNKCEVCGQWGKLFCCDTCPRSFHENCHIPPVEPERDPWSCIFCEMKALQERCPESPPRHQESEVLMRQMLPEEQLKCEFILLMVYCDSKSPFFALKPCHTRDRSQGPEKPMWLNKVKESLNKKMYPQVKEFVEDMRLIFQNYKEFYKKNKFSRLGLQVENKFEENFKNTFSIQETSKNNS